MSIQVGTAGLFGFGIQANGLGQAAGTYRWFPYTGLGYGPVQPMQTLPPEAGRTIFTRSNYKTGVWGQGPLSIVPRLDGNLGYLLACVVGHDRYLAANHALTVNFSPATTPALGVVSSTAGTFAFANADTLFPVGRVFRATLSEDATNNGIYVVTAVTPGVITVSPAPAASNVADSTITFNAVDTLQSAVVDPTSAAFHVSGTIIFTGAAAIFPAGSVITATLSEDGVLNNLTYTVTSVTGADTLNVTPVPGATNATDTDVQFQRRINSHFFAGETVFIGAAAAVATSAGVSVAFHTGGTIIYTGAASEFPAGSIFTASLSEDAGNDLTYLVVSTTGADTLNVLPVPGAINAADTTTVFTSTANNSGYHVLTGKDATALYMSGATLQTKALDAITLMLADSRKEMVSNAPVTPTNVAMYAGGVIAYTGAVAAFPVGSVIEATAAENATNNKLYTVTAVAGTTALRVEPKPAVTNGDDDTITFRKVYELHAHEVATAPSPYAHLFTFKQAEEDIPYFTTRRVLPYSGHSDETNDKKRGEQVGDNRCGSMELSLPAVGPLAANVDLVGRNPAWVVENIDATWNTDLVTFDNDDTYALSCDTNSTITLNGVELKATGCVITIGNNLLTPDQARIIGDYSPVDYPVLSRSAMVRVTAFVEDYETYNRLFTNTAGGLGTAWSSTILRGDIRIRAFSPVQFSLTTNAITESYQYAIEFCNGLNGSGGNVAWGLQNALAIQPQQPIMITLMGVLEFIDSNTPPFTINFLTDQTSAYV